jgi:hypothetical protein
MGRLFQNIGSLWYQDHVASSPMIKIITSDYSAFPMIPIGFGDGGNIYDTYGKTGYG